jgi:DNA sulfur modification protein DndD
MILEQLTLRNFCLFRGQQVFDLAPAPPSRKEPGRPIVLVGGRNGTGKTTVLDAIQLALYGARARCSKRDDLAYSEYLRQSMHLGASGSDGAGVSLSFRYASGGEDHLYEVCRSWYVQGTKVREDLRVYQDGLPDRRHTEHWTQLVEDLFPLEVSQLFFFDAEKIRSLAEDETSSQVLGTAVKSLLGLDIVERLIADTTPLLARFPTEAATAQPDDEKATLEREIEALGTETDALQRSELENHLQRAKEEQKRAEETFAAVGGPLWAAKEDRKRTQTQLESERDECERRLVALSATELPLCLVEELLTAVQRQDLREQEASEAAIIQRILSERDDGLVGRLNEAKTPARLIKLVTAYLESDRQDRMTTKGAPARLSLPEGARSLLHHLTQQKLGELRAESVSLLARLKRVRRKLQDLEDAQKLTPDDERVGQIMAKITASTARLTSLDEEAKRMDKLIAARKVERETRRNRLQAILKKEVKEDFARDDRRRMSQMVGRTRLVMQEFLARATERKIDRLSELITESFRFLLRKQTLVERIAIHPTTFAIALVDDAGRTLAKQRLSEGEKQIFAISVLWGLARASSRPLPAIIDTPMARLDATHRSHLIERYFPHASHQVIILSTDTEVDHQYYQALRPHIARAYHLNYSEATKATTAEEGYFWSESPGGALRVQA